MPLVRFEVRNEYGLGQPELYREADREDPKAVLDGLAVAGLVGILRQLGDLAEFAAEVFHGLQEQVITTASRSHKLVLRVQKLEAALPSLEKAVLAQTSHIHFAYTAGTGSEWHPRILNEQNHFIYNDLPRFVMDTYEECRDLPHLHWLDKFDTSGPGSCLKRYSDPTFFRRVSGNLNKPDAGIIQRDKMRKSKKKRSFKWNEDLLNHASMSTHSGRMHFTPSIVNGQTSPTHTASTIDMTLKSDLTDPSVSFDSRNGSGNNECVFHLSSSLQCEELGSKEFSSRFMMHNDIVDSGFTNGKPGVVRGNFPQSSPPHKESSSSLEHNDILDLSFTNSPGFADDNFPFSSSIEQIAPSISCVTWDEKAEIVEPNGQHCNRDEMMGMLAKDSDLHIQEKRIANCINSDEINVVHAEGNILKSSIMEDELDEVDSEPDNYMDALNTIESESENDFDCQIKHEGEQVLSNIKNAEVEGGVHEVTIGTTATFPSEDEFHTSIGTLSNKGIEIPRSSSFKSFVNGQMSHDGVHEVTDHMLDHHPPKPEFHTSSDITSKKEISLELLSSVPSRSTASEISGTSSNVDYSPGSECCTRANALNGIKAESAVTYPLSSGSGSSNQLESLSDKTITSSIKSPESQAQPHHLHSVSIWTNGGLLGLEPSKPPDFAASNRASQTSVPGSNYEAVGSSNHGKPGGLVKDSGSIETSLCSISLHEDQNGRIEKSNDSSLPNRFSPDYCNRLNISSAVTPGNEAVPDIDVKPKDAGPSQENYEISSQMFGTHHRLFTNGFRRQMQFVSDGPALASLLKTVTLEQKSGHCSITCEATQEQAVDEPFVYKNVLDSLTSSPPLEHMKIPFCPIDGIEASKMRLKFPDGSCCDQRIRDAFPLFQLVPDSSISLHEVVLESDDDIFCRSSPYISDDYLDQHSVSDSEQWESSESPECNDHVQPEALSRISLVGSVSRPLQLAQVGNDGVHNDTGVYNTCTQDAADSALYTSLLDIPSFDSLNFISQGETKDNSDQISSLEAQYPVDSTPMPPPLPPVQWRISKAHSDMENDRHHAVSGTDERCIQPK
uniref:Protein SCAR n=1 Tax=Rhizophora mucronata TaxID=61149 RepID=A0A2P2JTG2_RHIMU